MTLILGRKRGMTQVFEDDGSVVPVTVVEAGPCVVCQLRTQEKDGYNAVQLGFEDVPDRLVRKPQRGHFARASVAPKRVLREERLDAPPTQAVGDLVKVDVFAVGAFVDVIGTSKGRGFTGTIKRHNFQRGPKTHGCMNYRQPGSIGTKRTGKLFPGKRMSGHFGDERTTTKNMRVVRVDADRNLLFVKGAIAGPNGGLVQVLTAKTAPAPKQVQVGKAGKAAGGKR